MELALFAVWCFLVALAGGLVGLVLGNLRLPATLVRRHLGRRGRRREPRDLGDRRADGRARAHARAGRINWRLVAWMGPPSIAGAVAGGYLAGAIPDSWLLLVIAVVLVQAGIELLRRPMQAEAGAGGGRRRRPRRPRRRAQRRCSSACWAGWSA